MRDIKFRAWDKTNKKYLYFEGIFNKRPYTETSSFPQYDSSPQYHDLDIEQYLGIKDDNNVELYKGDILQISMQHCKQEKPYIIDDIQEFYGDYYQSDMYYAITNIKVIGNIHDNPELVKEELKWH